MPGLPLDELLQRYMEQNRLTLRAMARLLAGDGASSKEIDRWRRGLYHWLEGKTARPENAARLGEVLGVEPAELVRPRASASRRLDRLERRLERLEDLVSQIEQRLWPEAEAPK